MALTACSGNDALPKRGSIAEPRCSSGTRWAGTHASWQPDEQLDWDGKHERSVLMHPGRNCIGCHALSGAAAATRFVVAGTIYGAAAQANDCFGVDGITVIVTDANNKRYEMVTNQAGNFRLEHARAPGFAMPYRAAIRAGGREIAMPDPQTVGSCNFCHGKDGQLGAAGRIVAPRAGSDAGVPAPDSGPRDAGVDAPPAGDGPQPKLDVRPERDSQKPVVDRGTPPPDSRPADQCVGVTGTSCTTNAQCCSRRCAGPPGVKRCL